MKNTSRPDAELEAVRARVDALLREARALIEASRRQVLSNLCGPR